MALNNSDEYPNDPTESADTDNDGIGDKSDINPEVNLGITITIKKFKVTGHLQIINQEDEIYKMTNVQQVILYP